ncbi:potassium channel family protein [Pseudonocardia kujensis]|uniref:potassium channel family protein n=1 Tax=Pseudonocardia kujensis TaxID=1128675 RepID=UPI001E5F9FE2|nr:potassium channel family protein [Pseudonocardia kujensis]MCE0766742.1 potassium channel family protein [Pseudonocardia kujensis]
MRGRPERRRSRRRQIAASLIRSVVSTVLLVVLYYRAPLDRPIDVGILVWFLAGLTVLAGAVVWQTRAIIRSDVPRLRAAETATIGLPALLLLYSSIYTVMSTAAPAAFTQRMNHTDALYFTTTVFATVGFGDITPVTQAARIVVTTQMITGLLAVGVVAKLLLGAVQRATTSKDG